MLKSNAQTRNSHGTYVAWNLNDDKYLFTTETK